jgi:hypothetical protein
MDIYEKIVIVAVGIVFSLDVMEVNPVQAATFSFSLDDQNVTLGGLLSGTFKAFDNNSDGLITQDEVTDFEVDFKGDNFLQPLEYNLENLVALNLNLNNFNDFDFLATDSSFLTEFATANNFFKPNSDFNLNKLFANDPTANAIATSNQYNPFVGNVGTTVYEGGRGEGTSAIFNLVELPIKPPENSCK